MSDDPNELQPLTPAHFLTGTSNCTIPEPDISEVASTRLSRWQRVLKMYQTIWTRWSSEYLHTLQQKTKWKKECTNLQIGSLVIIQESNLPPTKWLVGRILNVYTGRDGRVRVVDINTRRGIIQRSITKICPFPQEIRIET